METKEISKQRAMCEFALALNKQDIATGDVTKARVKEYKYDLLAPMLDANIVFFTFNVGTYKLFNFSQKSTDKQIIKTTGGLFDAKHAVKAKELNITENSYNPELPAIEFYFSDFEAIKITSVNTIKYYINSILPCFSFLHSIVDHVEVRIVQTRADYKMEIKICYTTDIMNCIAEKANLFKLEIVLGEKSGETCKKKVFEFILNLEASFTKLLTKLNVVIQTEDTQRDIPEIYLDQDHNYLKQFASSDSVKLYKNRSAKDYGEISESFYPAQVFVR